MTIIVLAAALLALPFNASAQSAVDLRAQAERSFELPAGTLFQLDIQPVKLTSGGLQDDPTKKSDADKITVYKVQDKTFVNSDCAKTDSCGLKKIYFRADSYEVEMKDMEPSWGMSMHALYETDSMPHLEDYVFVQFIRGCVYNEDQTPQGLQKQFWGRTFFGKEVPFHHPNWVIDSDIHDPALSAMEDWSGTGPMPSRYALCVWNRVPGSFDPKTQVLYTQEKPDTPMLYVEDLPTQGSVYVAGHGAKNATNVSLQFRTCMYKTSQVPRTITPDNIDFAAPIDCFEWSSSFIYNRQINRYETKKDLDPFCAQP